MHLNLPAALAVTLLIHTGALSAATVAHWNFDEGTAGQFFSDNPANDLSGNGYDMSGFSTTFGPAYSPVGATASGTGLSLDTMTGGRDGYTTAAGINSWSPEQWTIEATVALDVSDGFRTIIGRDGSSFASPLSNFYLQRFAAANGGLGSWRVDFSTVGGQRITIDTAFAPTAGVYYQLAVTSDGSNARFLVNDTSGSSGYLEIGSVALTGGTAASNALASNGGNWTFGRGWYNGGFVDHIDGRIDDIRFSDAALAPSQLLPVPEPVSSLLFSLGALGLLQRRRR